MVRSNKIITVMVTILMAVSGANAGIWQDTKDMVANAATNTFTFV